MPILTTLDDVAPILASTATIAVLGAHRDPVRPAFYVPDYLRKAGYRVLPVNPRLTGEPLFEAPVHESLTAAQDALGGPFDMVDVFRAPDALMPHLDELLALRPKVVWLQLGITHPTFERTLSDAGLTVVSDRCTLADHKVLRLGARA
jgi:hypothetical protein